MNEAKTKAEMELAYKLKDFVERNTPVGTRIELSYSFAGPEVSICCVGAVPISAWYCGLAPGHRGRCYTFVKHVDFDSEKPL